MLLMIDLKLQPSECAKAVVFVSNATFAGPQQHYHERYDDTKRVKELADQIMLKIMAQPAVLTPHIGALIDWCLNWENHDGSVDEVAAKVQLLEQLPAAEFAAHANKLVTFVCTCTDRKDKLKDLSFNLCFRKLEPAVRAATVGAELKRSMQESSQQANKQLRLISLLRSISVEELAPFTDVFTALLGASLATAVVASELLCTLPDEAVAPHIAEMTALLMKLDDDISSPANGEARALRLVKALASLSPALLYANAEALVGVRHRHPVTHVRNAMAEVVVRAAQMLDA